MTAERANIRPRDPTVVRDHEMLRLFIRLLPRLVGAERCGIFIHDPHAGTVWTKCGTGIAERQIEVPLDSSIVGRCISGNQILVAEGMDAARGVHKATDAATNFTTRNLLCVPIPAPGNHPPIGAVEMLNKIDGSFTEEDQALVAEVARYISFGLEHFYQTQDVLNMMDMLRERSTRAQHLAYGAIAVCAALTVALVAVAAG